MGVGVGAREVAEEESGLAAVRPAARWRRWCRLVAAAAARVLLGLRGFAEGIAAPFQARSSSLPPAAVRSSIGGGRIGGWGQGGARGAEVEEIGVSSSAGGPWRRCGRRRMEEGGVSSSTGGSMAGCGLWEGGGSGEGCGW